MISVISLNMVGYMTTISLAPVAPTAAEYYQVSGDRIDMFPLVGMGVNVPGLLIGLFIIEKYGIKVGMRFGSTCLLLGALVRALSTFPAYEESLEGPTKFWITFTGHVIIAIGHPFLMTQVLQSSVNEVDEENVKLNSVLNTVNVSFLCTKLLQICTIPQLNKKYYHYRRHLNEQVF